MKKSSVFIICCLCFVFCFGICGISSADKIMIVADQWCPYNCEPESDRPGYMVEITKMIFARAGHTVIYKNVPWNRALSGTYKGYYQAVIAGTPDNTKLDAALISETSEKAEPSDSEFIFPEKEQGRMNNCFFIMKNNPWRYKGPDSLKGQMLGLVQGYGYPAIQSFIDKNSDAVDAIGGDNVLARNIQKLLAGRISVILEDKAVFQYTTSGMGLADKFISAGCDGTSDEKNNLYIAFTPQKNNPKSETYAKILSEGMNTIRENKMIDNILQKYGLTDWIPDEQE